MRLRVDLVRLFLTENRTDPERDSVNTPPLDTVMYSFSKVASNHYLPINLAGSHHTFVGVLTATFDVCGDRS